jgi:hypothetical protein
MIFVPQVIRPVSLEALSSCTFVLSFLFELPKLVVVYFIF